MAERKFKCGDKDKYFLAEKRRAGQRVTHFLTPCLLLLHLVLVCK